MLQIVVLATMCYITVPTSDPTKDVTFSDCKEEIMFAPVPEGAEQLWPMFCRAFLMKNGHKVNSAELNAIRKATKFPYTSKKRVVKYMKCLTPTKPQSS